MRATVLISGTDGNKSYNPQDEYVGDSEWLRKLLVHGLATPLDDEARAVVANPAQHRRFAHDHLKQVAAEMGIKGAGTP